MFVLAAPGLAPLVQRELADLPGVEVTDVGNDGRADVVLCTVDTGREAALLRLRTADDVFAELGRTFRSEGDKPPWIVRRVLRPGRLEAATGLWRSTNPGPGSRGRGGRAGRQRLTYRVVARVLQERTWKRTELRRALDAGVSDAEPSWRADDPAQVEVWALEYTKGRFVAGLRLTTVRMRQHGGRGSERPGALRPPVAAAMVALAGPPPGRRPGRSGMHGTSGKGSRADRSGLSGTLLDPCCGSGTILAEAKEVGWEVEGRDIDAGAVSASRRNADTPHVQDGDARDLDLPDASVDAVVSNLPFGRQYAVQGDPAVWIADVMAELARVTRPGGRVVLLVPELPKSAVPSTLRLRDRHQVRLLGTTSTIWAYDRR
ncbi:methyltransferase domain-containing protein [Actinopolymorpha singaporensis]|uniref:Methyltransferase domain-containing protein n=1 Tax=Actinopolymorpha singaporensis TaxID=117157 RepID=A0A1H1WMT8_9ACTN|nr:methyltransferase domain-containing protein [Actinopolymorpha singaporensis]SDS98374.1 Methyltransferase domain-containing protein [Actinopolymorpha singaporensis]